MSDVVIAQPDRPQVAELIREKAVYGYPFLLGQEITGIPAD